MNYLHLKMYFSYKNQRNDLKTKNHNSDQKQKKEEYIKFQHFQQNSIPRKQNYKKTLTSIIVIYTQRIK